MARRPLTGIIVAVANGLLEVETRRLLPHSPQFFNQTAVPFDYDKDAPQPKRWYDFLDALWLDEADAIDVLGEWFGYVISGRLDLHKILVMVGPTRGGKGVIARILIALIGKHNVCGPTLSSLGGEFGLAPLLGKSLAIISDARSGVQRLTIDNENHFTRFEAAEEAITIMRDLASPVGAFVREKCTLGSDDEIAVDALYDSYKDWCQVCEYPKSDKARFGRDLRAACPSVKKTRPRDESNRYHVYRGIRLRTEKDEAEEAEQGLPLGGLHNAPVTVTTMTKDRRRAVAGHGSHGDRDIVESTRDGPKNPARERETVTYRGKSDDLPYTGPPVDVPDQGPDPLDAHGAPLAATPTNGGEPGLSSQRIRKLADWYKDETNRRYNENKLETAALDADLRAILRKEMLPEFVEAEFERVLKAVFAM